jgi:hypothetical protein
MLNFHVRYILYYVQIYPNVYYEVSLLFCSSTAFPFIFHFVFF